MRKWKKRPVKRALMVFSAGALGYGLIEVLYRGYTHWTMLLTGGACFSALYGINRRMRKKPLWLRCLTGAAVITAAEYGVGMIVNRRLHMDVWDYSHLRGNIRGQICPQYMLAWFALCAPAFGLCRMLERRLG